jgi:hypothetical protein
MERFEVVEKTGKELREAGTAVSTHDDADTARAEADRLKQEVELGDTKWYEVRTADDDVDEL